MQRWMKRNQSDRYMNDPRADARVEFIPPAPVPSINLRNDGRFSWVLASPQIR
jgi:hypothetical protein